MIELREGARVHFVGIGGIGMSALAEILHHRGYVVTGSDREDSEMTDHLGSLGMEIRIGHAPEAVADADAVVYTPAVGPDNPEVLEAERRGLPALKRAALLGQLARRHRVVGVAGTHGKTTTTAMVGCVVDAAGLDPTVFVGGVVRGLERNVRCGQGEIWVVEADEFDRSLLTLSPEVAVVTSLEADHLDCYGNLEAVERTFEEYLDLIPAGGAAVLCGDAARVRRLGPKDDVRRILYGFGTDADLRAANLRPEGLRTMFEVITKEGSLGDLRLRIPGRHNVLNALAAVGTGMALDVPWSAIEAGLEAFQGVHRRLEVLGEANGVTVVNDYAHHPTEIRATLATVRGVWKGRVVAVFQPHLYSRTRDLSAAFGEALADADRVWVTEVYPAREAPIAGVDGALVAERVQDAGGPEPRFVPRLAELTDALAADVEPGDVVVVMGAGDVEQVAYGLLNELGASTGRGPKV
jgi:UDP-N-acetylmuramate--alanine ligase